MTTIQTNLVKTTGSALRARRTTGYCPPSGSVKSTDTTPPTANRPAMTAAEQQRGRRVLTRLMRACGKQREPEQHTGMPANTQFRNRIVALALALTKQKAQSGASRHREW